MNNKVKINRQRSTDTGDGQDSTVYLPTKKPIKIFATIILVSFVAIPLFFWISNP